MANGDTYERSTDPAALLDRVTGLSTCCLANWPDGLAIERVDLWTRRYPAHGWGPEGDEAALFLCADGRWAVLEGWEDSTGHGCQCGSAVSFHATREGACRLGLSDNGRALLGLNVDGMPLAESDALH